MQTAWLTNKATELAFLSASSLRPKKKFTTIPDGVHRVQGTRRAFRVASYREGRARTGGSVPLLRLDHVDHGIDVLARMDGMEKVMMGMTDIKMVSQVCIK